MRLPLALLAALLLTAPTTNGDGLLGRVGLDGEGCYNAVSPAARIVEAVGLLPNETRPLDEAFCDGDPSSAIVNWLENRPRPCLEEDDECVATLVAEVKGLVALILALAENPPQPPPIDPDEAIRIVRAAQDFLENPPDLDEVLDEAQSHLAGPVGAIRDGDVGALALFLLGVAVSASCEIDYLGPDLPLLASCMDIGLTVTKTTSVASTMEPRTMSSTTDSECTPVEAPSPSGWKVQYAWQNDREAVDENPNSPHQDWCKWEYPDEGGLPREKLRTLNIRYCGNQEGEPQGRYYCWGTTGMIHHYTVLNFLATDVGYKTSYKYELWGLFEQGKKHPCTSAKEETCWGYLTTTKPDGPFQGTTTAVNAVAPQTNGLHGSLPGKGGFGGGLWWQEGSAP